MARLRIAYIHQYFSTPEGSTGTRSFEFASRLASDGHEVTMVCAQAAGCVTGLSGPFRWGYRRGHINGITVLEFRGSYSNAMTSRERALEFIRFALRATLAVLLLRKLDVILATSTPLTVAIPALVSKLLRGVPFVFEVRDLWPGILVEMGVLKNRFVIGMATTLERLAYIHAAEVVCLAPGIVDAVRHVRGCERGVHFVSNGCDLSLFPEERHDTPKAFSADRPMRVVFAGSHGEANGLDFVLRVAKHLSLLKIDKIHFTLIGDGSQKPELERMAKEAQLQNVSFRPPIPKQQIAELLPTMDLGMQILAPVGGFHHGTSPNKFFDYLAASLPVIANYPGWVSDLVQEMGCGWLAESEEDFGNQLIEISKSPIQLKRAGLQSRVLAEQSFSRERLYRKFRELIYAV